MLNKALRAKLEISLLDWRIDHVACDPTYVATHGFCADYIPDLPDKALIAELNEYEDEESKSSILIEAEAELAINHILTTQRRVL